MFTESMMSERIRFLDLKSSNDLSDELDSAYYRVHNSSQYIGGMEVEAFEKEWAEYCGADYCVGVGNGHDALMLSCMYMDSKTDNKPAVSVPWKTCLPTWAAIRNANCIPVLGKVKNKLSVAVHIYGNITLPDEYDRNLLIEDCAQAHGAKKNGVKAGKFGKIAAWSFYPTKNLGAYGDAGAITTDDLDVYEFIRDARNYGTRDNYGVNSRLDPLQAAFLRVKLKYLDKYNKRRKENAQSYFDNIIIDAKVNLPYLEKDSEPCWHIFAIETDNRDDLRKYLLDNGVETMIHYPEPPYPTYWYNESAELWAKRTLSLPVAPHMTPHLCGKVSTLINQWMDA